MPDDSTGSFFLPTSYKVAEGDDVLPTQHNPPLEDLAQTMSNRLHKDGRTAWTGNQNANSNKLTGLADGTADSDAATVGQAAMSIGDGKWSVRELDATWLRRDGSLYDKSDYPDLADLLPDLPDGVIWTLKASNTANPSYGIVEGSDRFVASASGGSNTLIIASIDGGDWNLRAEIETLQNATIAYGANIYVAVDQNGRFSVSNGGDTWSSSAEIVADSGFTKVVYGAGLFVAVGVEGSNRAIYTSDDGNTWTEQTGSWQEAGLFKGIAFVNDTFIAVGNGGLILTSTDGETWTARTSGSTANLIDAAYADGTYVVVGAGGTILTSTDLAGWTSRSSGVTTDLNAVVGSDNGFLAVGANGIARISSAGTTWTAAATGITGTLRDAIVDSANSARYIVVGPVTNHLYGLRTLTTQFRVPDDDPDYGWIKALNELPEET